MLKICVINMLLIVLCVNNSFAQTNSEGGVGGQVDSPT